MAIKKRLLSVLCIFMMAIVANSCKKDNQDFLTHYLTAQPWELVSVEIATYVGATQISDVFLDDCLLRQQFSFNTDNTCSYQNFACRADTAKGSWQFGEGRVLINSGIQCKDTTVTGITGRDTVDHPFTSTKIRTLGAYSMVLVIGDGYYNSTTRRVVRTLGFIHPQ